MLVKILSVFFIFFFWFLYSIRNKSFLNVGSCLVFLYFMSMLGSVFLPLEDIEYSFEAAAYLFFIWFMFFVPALAIRSSNFSDIKTIDLKIFNLVSWCFIVSGIYSIVFFAPIVIDIFLSGESLVILRTDMVAGETYYDAGFAYYVATLASQFYPIAIIFYFYSKLFTKNSGFFNALLLLSSTSYIFNVLASVGRDGFVLWGLSLVFAFLLFNKFIDKEQAKTFKKLFILLSIAFAFAFIPITFSRFIILGGVGDVYFSILSYFSQQFGYFNEMYNSGIYFPSDVSKIFPIVDLIAGRDKVVVDFLADNLYYKNLYGIDINVFKTFVGDFYLYLGYFGTLIFSVTFGFVGWIIFRNNGIVSLEKIIILTLAIQIPLHGLFYYKLGHNISNVYMLVVFSIVLFFYFSRIYEKKKMV